MMKFSNPAIHEVTKIEAESRLVGGGGEPFAVIDLVFTGTRDGLATMAIYLPAESHVYAARLCQAINQINASVEDALAAEKLSDETPF